MDPREIEASLTGDRQRQRALYERLLPIVHAAVARRLYALARPHNRDPRQDLEDFVQDVLRKLWDNGGKVLLAFDPARGSFEGYVSTITDRHILNTFRSKSRDPYAELSISGPVLESHVGAERGPEPGVVARDQLAKLEELLREHLDDFGLLLLRLFVEGQSTADICAATGLRRDTVYQRRRRMNQLLARLLEQLRAEGPTQSAVSASSPSSGTTRTE